MESGNSEPVVRPLPEGGLLWLGEHTYVTAVAKHNRNVITAFRWRGVEFKLDGRRRKYESVEGWWVAHTKYHMFAFLKEGDQTLKKIDDEMQRGTVEEGICRFLAHSGHGGDGAERDSIEQALDSALLYSMQYHQNRTEELLKLWGVAL